MMEASPGDFPCRTRCLGLRRTALLRWENLTREQMRMQAFDWNEAERERYRRMLKLLEGDRDR